MSEHSCTFCRVAREMHRQQIDRYLASKKPIEEFLNDPKEEEWSSDQTALMIEHDKLKSRELRSMH